MVTTGSGNKPNDDYYTPPEVFEALGLRFDLDVCAPHGGISWIPADRHYTIDEDGLAQPWSGRVWMNPPFSNSTPWVDKWIEHANGIALVPTSRAQWWGRLWNSEAAIAHPVSTPMFRFVTPSGQRKNIYMPIVFAALGQENTEALARLGRVR
jgi:hypothetical protein